MNIRRKLTARSPEGERLEVLGYRRIPNSRSTYWKLLGGTELCVVRLGHGEKTCDFDRDQVPDNAEELAQWAETMAMAIVEDHDFAWRK